MSPDDWDPYDHGDDHPAAVALMMAVNRAIEEGVPHDYIRALVDFALTVAKSEEKKIVSFDRSRRR